MSEAIEFVKFMSLHTSEDLMRRRHDRLYAIYRHLGQKLLDRIATQIDQAKSLEELASISSRAQARWKRFSKRRHNVLDRIEHEAAQAHERHRATAGQRLK